MKNGMNLSYIIQLRLKQSFISKPFFIFFFLVGKCIEHGNSKKYPPGTGPPVGESCPECGRKFHLGGPIWSEAIHNQEFVQKVLDKVKNNPDEYKTSERMIG